MPQKNQFLKKTVEFFVTRFFLRENSLWRVLGLIRPHKRQVIAANILLTIASILGSFVLISLMPLFQFTLNPDSAKDSVFTRKFKTHAETTTTQSLALAETGMSGPGGEKSEATGGVDGGGLARQAAPQKSGVKPPHSKVHQMMNSVPLIKRLDDKLQAAKAAASAKYAAVMAWGHENPKEFVLYVCGLLLGLLILQGSIQFAGDSLMGKVSINVTGGLLRNVYGNVLSQEMKFFDQTSTGSLINTCYREVFELRNIITFLVSKRVMLPVEMLTLFCTLLFISWQFTLLLCCLLPLVIVPTMILTRSLKRAIREMMQGEAGPVDMMTEAFHGIRAIKAFGAEDYEKALMNPAVAEYEGYAHKRRSSQAMIEPTVDVLNTLVIILVFAAICVLLPGSLRDPMVQGKLLAFMATVQRFYKPFRAMMTMNLSMQRASMAARRIFTLLDRKPQIVDTPGATEFPEHWKALRFDDIYLAYEVFFKGQSRLRKALRGVKLTIRRGEAVAFVGPNGAGKSSVVNLICRLYDPTGGAIFFDDTPLKRIRLQSLREKVCLITQYPILFNRSVTENITFGLAGIGKEQVIEAAKAVNAHDFIMNLPDGYDSDVGEQGKLLSGGERQKLTLARAFVRHPDVLILDEPTTGLDKQTTQEFLELVSSLKRRGLTIIYITHEHTHLARFDRVLQLTAERQVIEVTASEATSAMLSERQNVGVK